MYALFPPSRIRRRIRCRSRFRSKVRKNYVHPLEFRKNSVAYVKITFSVSISSPLPSNRKYRNEFYLSVTAVRTHLELSTLFCARNSAPASWACRAIAAHTPQQQRHKRQVRIRFLRKRLRQRLRQRLRIRDGGNQPVDDIRIEIYSLA